MAIGKTSHAAWLHANLHVYSTVRGRGMSGPWRWPHKGVVLQETCFARGDSCEDQIIHSV
jgi:hypothetical protein